MKTFGLLPKFTKSVRLNDGEYDGIWSGHTVEIPFQDGKIEITSSMGVRGINIPCKVIVKDGEIEITTNNITN